MTGLPISVEAIPGLSVHRGHLLSAEGRGRDVYAASFLPERRIVVETALLDDVLRLRPILVHELFHFVWPRLGNPQRAVYAELLKRERERRARGELGESSNFAKISSNTSERLWKHYVCESFCDTAAYLLTGFFAGDPGTLKEHWIARRRIWFSEGSTVGWRF